MIVPKLENSPSPLPSSHLDAVWAALYRQQLPRVQAHACREYLDGFAGLELPAARIPSLAELNENIAPRTGWKTVRTDVRYTDAVPWYHHFKRREFLVTDYMRSWDELAFTPEPDMFHDIFGHLPFFTVPAYAELQELFAPAFLRATDAQREEIKRLAWFSTEFGLIRESGRRKIFGAGLISGGAEFDNAIAGRVEIKPFRVEAVLNFEKAVWSHNHVLFEFDSIEAVKEELKRYFGSIG